MPPHTKSTTTVVASSKTSQISTKNCDSSEEICHPRIVSCTNNGQIFCLNTDTNNNNDEKVSSQTTKEDYYEPIPLVRSAAVPEKFESHIRWPDLMAQLFLHVGFLYGLYFLLTGQAKFYTYIWGKLSDFPS